METNTFEQTSAPAKSHGLSQVNPTRSQEDEEKIRRGREAWGRQNSSWNDWMEVAEAQSVGQAEAMTKANTDQPRGKRYQKAIDDWLITNGFKGLDKGIRSRLLKCLKHRDEIERWRATLTEPERLRYNHPNAVLRKWESRTNPTKTQRKSQQAELTETVQKLEDENFALRQQIKIGKAHDSEFTESPVDTADIELFLPSNISSDVLQQLNGEMSRLQETFGLRYVWNAPISTNDGGDNA